MRMMVIFDLPTLTLKDNYDYRQFRKFLIENGFIMMQESVYCRLVTTRSSYDLLEKKVSEKIKNTTGLIMIIGFTEKEFANIKYVGGKIKTNVLSTTDRVVKI